MLTVEQARVEAEEYLTKFEHPADGIAMRSCWNCNPAHKHLKETDAVISCFICGGFFYKGVDITEYEEEQV